MTPLSVGLIVEGQGDALALPPLVRRIAEGAGRFDISIPQPFRVKRGRFAKRFDDFERALTFLAPQTDVICAVLDSDDECPVALSQGLLSRAAQTVAHRPVAVVAAQREFEAWLLAAIVSLRGYRGVREDATCPHSLESLGGPKGKLESLMETRVYSETVDQAKFACRMDIDEARSNSRSFDKFAREIERLVSVR